MRLIDGGRPAGGKGRPPTTRPVRAQDIPRPVQAAAAPERHRCASQEPPLLSVVLWTTTNDVTAGHAAWFEHCSNKKRTSTGVQPRARARLWIPTTPCPPTDAPPACPTRASPPLPRAPTC